MVAVAPRPAVQAASSRVARQATRWTGNEDERFIDAFLAYRQALLGNAPESPIAPAGPSVS
ncbi:MAG: hypothetical protein NVS2B7_13840 [Herpetosiphon sp.]